MPSALPGRKREKLIFVAAAKAHYREYSGARRWFAPGFFQAKESMSKNRPTIEQVKIACRHVDELMAAGVTENLAIRTLELFSDVYAKCHNGGNATPHLLAKSSYGPLPRSN